MNAAEGSASGLAAAETHAALGSQWRALRRAATLVAVIAAPAVYVWLHEHVGWSTGWSIVATLGAVIVVRGAMDLVFRKFIPWPSLFGAQDARLAEEDVLNRRRAWFWTSFFRWSIILGGIAAIMWWLDAWGSLTQILPLLLILPFYFILNFAILLGPMMWMGISQIHGYEPGDATWGVKLSDVRGQAEAKEEVRRIVDLWQSGEFFEEAGGSRERGLLFLGAPGTGKTMLAKAIATGFNSPIVTIPGSGFAQTFIGIDALMVRYLARKAKRLASKWGGQCIVFIDEIDAVGTRRSQLQGQSMTPVESPPVFFGAWGALNASGDLVVESAAWRDYLFAQRADESRVAYPPLVRKVGNILNQFPGGMMGGMGGMGQLALNQLLVTMDGIDNPPFLRRMSHEQDQYDPRRELHRPAPRQALLAAPPARPPTGNQIYFIGATNVPIEVLDPALTRPGRMGRHVRFRTPTKDDRKDIFDLYLDRVYHDPELDHPQRRDEIARITNGYSPAMIEQVCSMALTNAHHEGKHAFAWQDLVDADDHDRVRHGGRRPLRRVGDARRRHPRGGPRHGRARLPPEPRVEPTSIRMRGELARPPPGIREGGALQPVALGGDRATSSTRSARWPPSSRSTARTRAASAATSASRPRAAAMMVGAAGMGPVWWTFHKPRAWTTRREQQARERIMQRFEKIGLTLMNRTRGSADFHADPIASVLHDPFKRTHAAQILGQAFVTAHAFIQHNRAAVEKIADAVAEKQELYGDELVRLLDSTKLEQPEIDLAKESTWPKL